MSNPRYQRTGSGPNPDTQSGQSQPDTDKVAARTAILHAITRRMDDTDATGEDIKNAAEAYAVIVSEDHMRH